MDFLNISFYGLAVISFIFGVTLILDQNKDSGYYYDNFPIYTILGYILLLAYNIKIGNLVTAHGISTSLNKEQTYYLGVFLFINLFYILYNIASNLTPQLFKGSTSRFFVLLFFGFILCMIKIKHI